MVGHGAHRPLVSDRRIIGIVPDTLTHRQATGRTFIEEARRRQIVDAAIEVIVDEGYGQATLERIAKRAGVSRGLISYHFEGRDDLITAVFAKAYEDGVAYMGPRIAAATSPTTTLGAYIESNIEYLRDHRREVLALVAVRRAGNLVHLHSSVAGVAQSLVELERILRSGQEAGEFRDFDVHAMAIVIRNVIDGLFNQIAAEPDLDLDRFTAEVLTLVALATRAHSE